jgi:hypothetical protein
MLPRSVNRLERRDCMGLFRDHAAKHFEVLTGAPWHSRTGSMVNHRALAAAVIDSRDFLAAKRRAQTEVMVPAGPKVAFTGGLDFNGYRAIWERLDQVHAKHPDMVLLHGGSPRGAELIDHEAVAAPAEDFVGPKRRQHPDGGELATEGVAAVLKALNREGAVANLRVATSETWRDRNTGERRERTEWHRVVIFSSGASMKARR